MHSPVMHILLAMYLTVCSPTWCCCTVEASLGVAMLTEDVAAVGGADPCCARRTDGCSVPAHDRDDCDCEIRGDRFTITDGKAPGAAAAPTGPVLVAPIGTIACGADPAGPRATLRGIMYDRPGGSARSLYAMRTSLLN